MINKPALIVVRGFSLAVFSCFPTGILAANFFSGIRMYLICIILLIFWLGSYLLLVRTARMLAMNMTVHKRQLIYSHPLVLLFTLSVLIVMSLTCS